MVSESGRNDGLTLEKAAKQFYMVDVNGLITKDRKDYLPFQEIFAHARDDLPDGMNLQRLIEKVKPDMLIGLTGVGGTFQEDHIRTMAKYCDRPIIFPCSNPTSRAECSAEQVCEWTGGRGIFASGSPFSPFKYGTRKIHPSQSNNMYIFPGLGQGVVISKSRVVN